MHKPCLLPTSMSKELKIIRIEDHIHRGLKIESAKVDRPIAAFSSSLIGFALDQVKSGKLTISKLDEADKRRTAKKGATK